LKLINTIILGATSLAYPIAARLGSDCLVVERGISAGAEFSDAMDASPIEMKHEFNGLSAGLRDELLQRNILSEEGGLHILAVGGVLAERYLLTGCELLLNSMLESVVKTSDGMLATLFTPECGYTQYLAKNVIDTRVRDFMDCQKTFGVLLALDSGLVPFDDGEVYLQKGRFDDEFVLRFRVARNATIPDAQKLADKWIAENNSRIGNSKASGIALEFGWEFERPLDFIRDGIRYIPSAVYRDLISAVEGGEAVCL
jgi:hypothetical protein